MFIYVIVCNESLKLYVGQHKGDSLERYLQQKYSRAIHESGKRSHLYAAMRKHPRESWSIHPLVSGIESKAELDELEKHFIRVLKSQHPDIGYNICDGGEGFTGPHSDAARRKMRERVQAYYDAGGVSGAQGTKHSDEWKQQASLRAQAYRAIEETKNKISKTLMGHGFSSETLKKMSEAKKQKYVGEGNPFFGKHHSEEANQKNREAHLGRKQSPETIAKRLAGRQKRVAISSL